EDTNVMCVVLHSLFILGVCPRTPLKGLCVHQITWQRRLRGNPVENLGSYSELFGQHINELYQGKVILNETSLSSASLTLKNVTWADECCYICIFNVYPGDSKRKQTCLTVQGKTNRLRRLLHICSTTGKPAPTIRWRFSPNSTALHQTTPTTVANRDGTFTRSQNVTLRLTESWDGHAECVVQSGSRGERMKRVPFSWDAGWEKMVEDRETGMHIQNIFHGACILHLFKQLKVTTSLPICSETFGQHWRNTSYKKVWPSNLVV
uniref:Nectin-4-like n=1 Tax=Hippocampus comes TaxID=109280 RepID=A0A3Q2XJ35_HIPCM